MEFTVAHLLFVNSTTHFLARVRVKKSTKFPKFWWGLNYLYPKILSQIQSNFKIIYIRLKSNEILRAQQKM